MTDTDPLTDIVLVQSERSATIHAPLRQVDIAEWLLMRLLASEREQTRFGEG